MVTETSDSGIKTHGAPSDLDELMEDVSGKYNLLSEVTDISQLSIIRWRGGGGGGGGNSGGSLPIREGRVIVLH